VSRSGDVVLSPPAAHASFTSAMFQETTSEPSLLERDRMPKRTLPKNDGWTDVAYDFGLPAEDNTRISHILNEACHVFHYHAGGTWASADKDHYASALAGEIALRPGLVGRLLSTPDRVVKMLTYRALELSGTPQDDR